MNDAPVSFSAEEAGPMVGQTANWMKVNARAGKIPHTKVGRATRFTPQHLAEILRAGEKKPAAPAHLALRAPQRQRAAEAAPSPLQARTPRRKLAKGAA